MHARLRLLSVTITPRHATYHAQSEGSRGVLRWSRIPRKDLGQVIRLVEAIGLPSCVGNDHVPHEITNDAQGKLRYSTSTSIHLVNAE